jgi:3-oxoadipate enol-lactonase
LKEIILRQRPAGLAGALRAMAARPDSTLFLPEFNFPVLLIHGQADVLIPVERARQIKVAVKNGLLVEVESAGHMPMMEAPEITAQALQTFLK